MNTYVNLLSTTGLIGFLSYIYGGIRIFRLGYGARGKACRKIWAGLLSYLALTGLFISSEDIRHMYLFTGWLLSLITMKENELSM